MYYPPDTDVDLLGQSSTPKKKSFPQSKKWVDIVSLFCLGAITIIMIVIVKQVGIEQIRGNIHQLGIWGVFVLFLLRSTSIVIPAIPSTVYSVLAGTLFGFWQGFVIIAIGEAATLSDR